MICVPFCNITLAFALETAVIDHLSGCYNSNRGRKIPNILTPSIINHILLLTMQLVKSRICNNEYDALCYLEREIVIDDYTTKQLNE